MQLTLLCHFKFFCAHVKVITGEMLVFSYLMVVVKGNKKFNLFLKTNKKIEREKTKRILDLCFEIKKDIQNFSQIFGFFKVVFAIIEVATTLYTIWRYDRRNSFLDDVVNLHWLLELLLQTYLFLLPHVLFYKNVAFTVVFSFFSLFILDARNCRYL